MSRHTIYIFGGSCPLTEFCQVLKSPCIQDLRYPILAALLHGTRAVGVSQTLRRGILAAIPFNIAQSSQTEWLLSVLMCIMLFVRLCRTAADTDIAEDAKRIAMIDETDDSCPMHPLDGAADDRCTPEITGPVAEDKQELLEDVKIEDVRENNTEYQNLSIKVRAFDVHILMFS